MSAVAMTLKHNGIVYDAEISVVERTRLGMEDHGICTAVIDFASLNGGWHQSNAARGLDTYDKATDRRVGTAFGMDHIMTIAATFGLPQWEDIKGQRCLVLRRKSYGMIEGFADLSGERVMIFADHAAAWFPGEVSS
jgi:hypothetical protein